MTSQATQQVALTFGANVRLARERAGLKQREIARALDMETLNVHRWEKGKHVPTMTNLTRLADVLGVEVAWLLTEHDEAAA